MMVLRIYRGECSYIKNITWDDFIKEPEEYIKQAYNIQSTIEKYNIIKEL